MGVRRVCALLPADATGTTALQNSGYTERAALSYFEKLDHAGAADAGLLANLGGQVMTDGLWHAMAGMEREKQLIEKRIVAATRRTRYCRTVRSFTTEGGHPVRPAGHREDKFREGGGGSTRLAVRRTVPVPARDT